MFWAIPAYGFGGKWIKNYVGQNCNYKKHCQGIDGKSKIIKINRYKNPDQPA